MTVSQREVASGDAIVDARELRRFLVGLGSGMTAAGDSVDDVESRLRRVAGAYGAAGARITVLPTFLVLALGPGDTTTIERTQTRDGVLRLDQTAALFELVKQAERREIEPVEGIRRLAGIGASAPRFGSVVTARRTGGPDRRRLPDSPADVAGHRGRRRPWRARRRAGLDPRSVARRDDDPAGARGLHRVGDQLPPRRPRLDRLGPARDDRGARRLPPRRGADDGRRRARRGRDGRRLEPARRGRRAAARAGLRDRRRCARGRRRCSRGAHRPAAEPARLVGALGGRARLRARRVRRLLGPARLARVASARPRRRLARPGRSAERCSAAR